MQAHGGMATGDADREQQPQQQPQQQQSAAASGPGAEGTSSIGSGGNSGSGGGGADSGSPPSAPPTPAAATVQQSGASAAAPPPPPPRPATPPAAAPPAAAEAPGTPPQQPPAPRRRGGATIKAAGAKAQQVLSQLQERPLPKVPASLVAFLAAGALCTGLLYNWARGTSARRNSPYAFTMSFSLASKVTLGTPLRMKGVQIGKVTQVSVEPTRVAVKAEVYDSRNVVPRGSRFDINSLGLVPEAFLDITTPDGCSVAGAAGPHSAACRKQGLIVCHDAVVEGSQGSSMDFLMKVYLQNLDTQRARPQLVEGERYTPAPRAPAAADGAAAAAAGGSKQQQ
ncbi:ABC-type transport system protein [Raphidocelis subcapitata]|uniref:ABC-type transport system protein n=1 Tax=Raphidocelis subcapitata TaxID=307507 RepID=A0A2V0NPK7_9CHLO|nr:ABC-type transport system protein [Raphidocelis subcapitata]|eukprot:GBF89558.1 ABC-type transport system protein [Raphidocelis subcapitata]